MYDTSHRATSTLRRQEASDGYETRIPRQEDDQAKGSRNTQADGHLRRIDPDVRRQLVAAEAYFRAEKRGFAAGNELEDWVAAEVTVDSRLQETEVA